MSSELRVDQLNTVAGGTGNISITNGVKLTGAAGSIATPGQVIQTKSFVLTSTTSSTSSSFVDTGLELAITPSLTSSKILITGFLNCSGSYFKSYIILLRDSTPLSIGDTASNRPRVYAATNPGDTGWDAYNVTAIPLNFLDSPNTTSSVTYKTQYRPYLNSASTAYINRCASDRDNANYDERSISVMTLQEIAQ